MAKITIDEAWKNSDGFYECPFCKKLFTKKGISTHIWRSHGEGKSHDPNKGFSENRTIWNKGKTKNDHEGLKKASETYLRKIESGEIIPSFLGKKHSLDSKRNIGKSLSLNNRGGRCKWYTIVNPSGEEIRVQGTWELRFAKVLNVLDENWIKPSLYHPDHSFYWLDNNNEQHTYTPDFWSPRFKKYFEVKGYWWGNDLQKMKSVCEQNPEIRIEIIHKKEMESYENLIN